MKKTFRGIAPLIIVLIIIFFSISVMMDKKDDTKLTYNELLSAIQTGDVISIELSSEGPYATVIQKKDGKKVEKTVNIPDRGAFIEYAQTAITESQF